LFTNSVRGDLEAWLTRCRQRFGLQRPGQPRPLLSHRYRVPADFDESAHHQLELWTRFLQHFGLNEPPDISPLGARPEPASFVIGLVPGSENNPEKRWPIPHWCSLIAQLPAAANVVLFGTRNDRVITDEIEGRSARPLLNLAGQTTLAEYCDRLCTCSVLVTNDTGGMHLANALGVPLVALFGPTNPARTRPVFAAPFRVLQPPGCPPQGGMGLEALPPAQVLAAMRELAPDRFGAQ
jgi:ADP-heptose:LPS heptosyltransferase